MERKAVVSGLTSASLWLPLALLAVAYCGWMLLQDQRCIALSERDRGSYGALPRWQTGFEALSATCGAGLLTYSLRDDYTPTGRWVLAGLGVAGALLYLAAGRQVLGRLWAADAGDEGHPASPTKGAWRRAAPSAADAERTGAVAAAPPALSEPGNVQWPSVPLILGAFLALLVVLHPLPWVVAGGSGVDYATGAWNAVAALTSLGWLAPGADSRSDWIYALLGLVGALGWTVWLAPLRLMWPQQASSPQSSWSRGACLGRLPRGWGGRSALALGAYFALLLGAAALITALEVPRGQPHPGGATPTSTGAAKTERLAQRPPQERFVRSLVLVTCTATAGQATEPIADRGVSDGTKLVLSALQLIGGAGGSPGGGVKWLVLLWALAGLTAVIGLGGGWAQRDRARRFWLAGVACTGAVLALAVVVALGLLVIEANVASSYQAPPTFADALLEASSATAGGGLSMGLTTTITSFNLSRGIRQNVDLYQYGMCWLLAAMLLGRVLPIWILGRVAAVRWHDRPARPPQA